MRWPIVTVLLLMVLSGCQAQHPMAQQSTRLMGDFSPFGSFSVERRHNFILPYDASIYIANPVSAIVTDSGVDVNALFVEKLKKGFSQNFGVVYVGMNKERFAQAHTTARQMGAQFLLYGYIEEWANIKPLKLKQCNDDGQNADCESGKKDTKKGGISKIAVSIYEAASGKLVDILTVKSQRGAVAYLFEDNEEPLDQVVTEMIGMLSDRR